VATVYAGCVHMEYVH